MFNMKENINAIELITMIGINPGLGILNWKVVGPTVIKTKDVDLVRKINKFIDWEFIIKKGLLTRDELDIFAEFIPNNAFRFLIDFPWFDDREFEKFEDKLLATTENRRLIVVLAQGDKLPNWFIRKNWVMIGGELKKFINGNEIFEKVKNKIFPE